MDLYRYMKKLEHRQSIYTMYIDGPNTLYLDQIHGNFNDIGAHQDLQKPTSVMPKLLIKELWFHRCIIKSQGGAGGNWAVESTTPHPSNGL